MRPIDNITIHCSATETGNAKSIRQYHKDRLGWRDIGYHYVITKDGKVEEGRPIYMSGAHCPEVNMTSIGICLIGLKEFTKEQFDSLKFLVEDLKRSHQIKKVSGHCEYPSARKQGKSCPTPTVMEFIKDNWP
jgi:N-acetyl-anhydromuramyl-L-alanine amidase AmpD